MSLIQPVKSLLNGEPKIGMYGESVDFLGV